MANSGVELLKELIQLKKLDLSQTNLRKALLQSQLLLKDSVTIKDDFKFKGGFKGEFSSTLDPHPFFYEPLNAIKSLKHL